MKPAIRNAETGEVVMCEPEAVELDDEALVRVVAEIMDRGQQTSKWPEDEFDLYHAESEKSYSHAQRAVRRLRARKIIDLVRGG